MAYDFSYPNPKYNLSLSASHLENLDFVTYSLFDESSYYAPKPALHFNHIKQASSSNSQTNTQAIITQTLLTLHPSFQHHTRFIHESK